MANKLNHGKITPEIYEFIVKNATMSAAELTKILNEKYGVDITHDGTAYHLRRARDAAKIATEEASNEISRIISERVSKNTDPLLKIMEEEIFRVHNIIKDIDPDYSIPMDSAYLKNRADNKPSKSNWYLLKYESLLFELINIYIGLRPVDDTLNVNLTSESDIMDRMKKYEALYEQ